MYHAHGHSGYRKDVCHVQNGFPLPNLDKLLKSYLKHCPYCRVYETKRHTPYSSLQRILSCSCPYHTVTIGFIMALPTTSNGWGQFLPMTCKLSKNVGIRQRRVNLEGSSVGQRNHIALARLRLGGSQGVHIGQRSQVYVRDMACYF